MEFRPHIASDDDVSNFCDNFTGESVTDSCATTNEDNHSLPSSIALSSSVSKSQISSENQHPISSTDTDTSRFSGFSYVGSVMSFNEAGF